MLKKIYIGNLPFDITEKQVRELFAPYGDVIMVDMVIDYDTDQFRGFGFVEMEAEAAKAAIAGLKGHKFEGRTVKISEARSDKAAPGNHPGSNMHLRTSRSLFGGRREEFGGNGREAGNVRGSLNANMGRKQQGGNKGPKGKPKAKAKPKAKPKATGKPKGRKKN